MKFKEADVCYCALQRVWSFVPKRPKQIRDYESCGNDFLALDKREETVMLITSGVGNFLTMQAKLILPYLLMQQQPHL